MADRNRSNESDYGWRNRYQDWPEQDWDDSDLEDFSDSDFNQGENWEKSAARDRTRQWRRDPQADRGRYPQADRGRYQSNRGGSQFYGGRQGYNRDEFGNRYGQNYGADYGWDINRMEGSRYSEDYGRGYNRGSYQDTNRDYRSRYQSDRDQRNRGYRGGRPYPTAGMNADYGQNADYENRDYRNENIDYHRGAVGYDNEGAFYQDMDEPINYEHWEIWEIPGDFTGMGPRNYQRSDERIQEDVCERLTRHGWVDASDIEIDVNNGEVTLKGTVPNRDMKRMAEDVAENITGVKDIHNEIKVKKQDYGSDWGKNRTRGQGADYDRGQPRDIEKQAEHSMAGKTTAGAGLTSAGATSTQGMEAAEGTELMRRDLKEGMEVLGTDGKVIGRVKAIRQADFLVDREMARDVFVPYADVEQVDNQVHVDIESTAVDQAGWEKPGLI